MKFIVDLDSNIFLVGMKNIYFELKESIIKLIIHSI